MIYFSPAATTVWKCPTDDPKKTRCRTLKRKKPSGRSGTPPSRMPGEAVDEGPLCSRVAPVIKRSCRSGLPSHSLPARTGRRTGTRSCPCPRGTEETARLRRELLLGYGRLPYRHSVSSRSPRRTPSASGYGCNGSGPARPGNSPSGVLRSFRSRPRRPASAEVQSAGQVALRGNLARPKGQEGAHGYEQIFFMGLLLYQSVHQSGVHQVAVLDMEPLVASAALLVNLHLDELVIGDDHLSGKRRRCVLPFALYTPELVERTYRLDVGLLLCRPLGHFLVHHLETHEVDVEWHMGGIGQRDVEEQQVLMHIDALEQGLHPELAAADMLHVPAVQTVYGVHQAGDDRGVLLAELGHTDGAPARGGPCRKPLSMLMFNASASSS